MWASKNRGGHAAYDDGQVERTGSGGGEGTINAASASVIVEGDRESNGNLEDGGGSTMGPLVSHNWISTPHSPTLKQGAPSAPPPPKRGEPVH